MMVSDMFKENLFETFKNIICRDEGIYFSTLSEIAENPGEISKDITADKWTEIEYTAGEISGRAVVAGEMTKPEELVLNPNLSGWYKIYVSRIYLSRASGNCVYNNPADSIYMKLSGEEYFSVINGNNLPKPVKWGLYECAEELFFKCADMTNQKIILKKPDIPSADITSSVAWLRFVPVNGGEVEEYKEYIKSERSMHVHYDSDVYVYQTEEADSLARMKVLEETDAKICSHEYLLTEDSTIYNEKTPFHKNGGRVMKNFRVLEEKYTDYIKREIDFIKKAGIMALGAHRMSVSSYGMPHKNFICLPFADKNPDLYIKSRLGEEIKVCSYAYREVWDFTINQFKKAMDLGYDGISLIMHRGMFFGFEEPVKERFSKLYPDIDICKVPIKDERLHNVWCSFMTEFMEKLRKEMDEYTGRHVYINVILGTTPAGAKTIGLDVSEWAKKNLCDSFCQDVMEVYEILDGCLDENGYIDLEKYAEINKKRPIIARNSVNSEMEPLLTGAEEYQKIADETGKIFYGGILYNPYSRLLKESRDELRKRGVKNYSYFNYLHAVPDLTQLHIASKLGHSEIKEEYAVPKYYRVLSLDGRNISTFDPNWRG